MEIFKVTIEKLISDISASSIGFNVVEVYKGQYDTDGGYTNQPPECFVQFNGTKAIGDHTADGKIGAYAIQVTLFISAMDYKEANSLTYLEKLIDFIDGKLIKPTGAEVTRIKAGDSKLLGYLKGGANVFQLSAEII